MESPIGLQNIDPAEILPEIGREVMRTFDGAGRTGRRAFLATALAVAALSTAAEGLGPRDGASALMEVAGSLMGGPTGSEGLAALGRTLDPKNLASLGWDEAGAESGGEAARRDTPSAAKSRSRLSAFEVLAAQSLLALPLFGLYARRMRAIGWPIWKLGISLAVCAEPYPWAALAFAAVLTLWPEEDAEGDL